MTTEPMLVILKRVEHVEPPVTFPDRGPCWLWPGYRSGLGYGRIRVAGKLLYVHRVAYEWAKGPIPEGLTIDHLCSVRPCCNPEHLEAVSRGDNARRGMAAIAAAGGRLLRRPPTLENTAPVPDDRPPLTTAQVAALFNVHPKTVQAWAAAGKLESFRTPGDQLRFRQSDLDRWLGTNGPPADPEPTEG